MAPIGRRTDPTASPVVRQQNIKRGSAPRDIGHIDSGGMADYGGIVSPIGQDVFSRAAAACAEIGAAFAGKIEEATRTAPRHLVGGIIRALMAEQQAAIKAIMENASREVAGRSASARKQRGKSRRPPGRKKRPTTLKR